MSQSLRVALFADSFFEPNGVATLSREFAAFAQQQQRPFLCVRAGAKTQVTQAGSMTTVELKRSLASFPLDRELYCDPLLNRYKNWVTAQLRPFEADVVHITGPGDMGILGFWVAHTLGIPLAASWHTNLHEYAARRLDKTFSFLPDAWRERLTSTAEHQSLRACIRFYRMAYFLMAPNQNMVELLHDRTHKPAYIMEHGVDTGVYTPERREARTGPFCIGYVGRLTPEKNVRLIVELERSLIAAGQRDFKIVMVGDGSEKEWLRKHLQFGEFRGVLRGGELADAYAAMDVFVFPSLTDTFGLVLLEAMASGVPVVVSPETGARVDIQHGINGFRAADLHGFTDSVLQLMKNETLRAEMSCAARRLACSKVWPTVFEHLYRTYEVGLEETAERARGIVHANSR